VKNGRRLIAGDPLLKSVEIDGLSVVTVKQRGPGGPARSAARLQVPRRHTGRVQGMQYWR